MGFTGLGVYRSPGLIGFRIFLVRRMLCGFGAFFWVGVVFEYRVESRAPKLSKPKPQTGTALGFGRKITGLAFQAWRIYMHAYRHT